MKKFLSIALASIMALSLAACGAKEQAPAASAPAAPAASSPAAAETYNIGICQLVQHPALDAATQGFMDALEAALPGQVKFDNQNASGDIPMCSTIVNQFVSADVDLILANATPALQAASAATIDIPILGTSVTEYGVAMGIENFSGTVGGNISGTSDLAPLDKQADMILEWCPDAKNIGLLYCSAEPNSQYQVDTVQAYLEAKGLTVTQYPFADSNDMAAVTQTACDASDVIYVPTDNAVAAATGIIDGICQPAGIPVIAGEQGICAGCGIATLSISYYDLGVKTGEMAAQILKGEADISTMAIGYADKQTPKYNAAICEALGITPLEGYEPIA